MDLKDKTVVVTGGTGFIGTPLVERLARDGANVFCISRDERTSVHTNVHYIACDLLTLQDTQTAQTLMDRIGEIDYVVYAAASILPRSQGTESLITAKENNFDAFLYFLETLGKHAKKIVYTSTVDVYGVPPTIEYTEETPIRPISTYAVAKYCGEKYLELWSTMNDNIPYTMVRFSQVYGPREPLVRVVPFIVDAAMKQDPFDLYGGGIDQRRFLYVEDAVNALYAAMEHNTNDVFNIAGEDVVTIADVVATVERIRGEKMRIQYHEAQRDPVHNVPSIQKAKSQLHFIPSVSFTEGMQRIIEQYVP